MTEPDSVRAGVTHLIIPPRQSGMQSGTQIAQELQRIIGNVSTQSEAETQRRRVLAEEYIYQQFRVGNVPDFMRPQNYQAITFERTIGTRKVRATVRICPDYLAIGSNDDHIRVPLSAPVAQRIADRYDLSLPTGLIVDALDAEARRTGGYIDFYAAPTLAQGVTNPKTSQPVARGEGGKPWNPRQHGAYEGRWMLSGEFIVEQNRLITTAIARAGNPQGIRSGHKKDVIYDPFNYVRSNEGGGQCVVIYHRPFQGLSYTHTVSYPGDYSHGIRYLDSNVSLEITEQNGRVTRDTRSFASILNDPDLYRVISLGRVDATRVYRNMQIPLQAPPPRPQVQRQTQ